MAAPRLDTDRSRTETVVVLAQLLERVEASPRAIGAEQYRALVRQLMRALDDDLPGDVLDAVLGACPAAAELYENMHYGHAGLARQPLERSVASELLAAQLIARVARPLPQRPEAGAA
jgi:hypothetical protein